MILTTPSSKSIYNKHGFISSQLQFIAA